MNHDAFLKGMMWWELDVLRLRGRGRASRWEGLDLVRGDDPFRPHGLRLLPALLAKAPTSAMDKCLVMFFSKVLADSGHVHQRGRLHPTAFRFPGSLGLNVWPGAPLYAHCDVSVHQAGTELAISVL